LAKPESTVYEQTSFLSQVDDDDTNGSSFHDPAFSDNKKKPIHRWVPWIAGFSGKFVREIIDEHRMTRGLILDPFAGVGTTLVEAMLGCHHTVGFEINEYAAFASRLKTSVSNVNSHELEEEIKRFLLFYGARVDSAYEPSSKPPRGFNTRSAFYSPKVLRKVLILWDFIVDPSTQYKDLFKLAFAATMVKYSNYSYEPSLGTRKAAGKEDVLDFPVGEYVSGKLFEMAEDIAMVSERMRTSSRVICDSFFNYSDYLSSNSVDLVITSPPYLNNYHYIRNTRPQLYWLGYATKPKDLKPVEHENVGSYWQTVRGKPPVYLDFDLPQSDLKERLHLLREMNEDKGVYGGLGWANYAATYFNDCYTFAQGIRDLLKSRGTAVVVIGNSILQGIPIPTDIYFCQIAQLVGLTTVRREIPRDARVGSSIISSEVRGEKATKQETLYEAVVELRKDL